MYLEQTDEIRVDEGKNQTNIRKQGLEFADVPEMFDGSMLIRVNEREHCGERRYIGFGLVESRLMSVVYTERKHRIETLNRIQSDSVCVGADSFPNEDNLRLELVTRLLVQCHKTLGD